MQKILKYKSNRVFAQVGLKEVGNIWPTKNLTPRQKAILDRLSTQQRLGKTKLSSGGSGKNYIEKRLLSIFYGNLSWNQMRKAFFQASHLGKKGKVGNNFLFFLEKRLDSIIYRLNICSSFREARQLIVHKKILVNNKIVNIPSFLVNTGDIINFSKCNFSFSDKSVNVPQFVPKEPSKHLRTKLLCKTKSLHLEINYKIQTAVFLFPPQKLIFPSEIIIPSSLE